MQQLIDQLAKERREHLQRIENVTLKDIKKLVSFFVLKKAPTYRKQRITCLAKRPGKSCNKSAHTRTHGLAAAAKIRTLTQCQS